jgi:Cellulose binding domain
MLRRLLLAAVATVVVPLAALLVPNAANAATTAACTGGVAVSQFAFNPPSVPPGSGSALTLVLQNCTSQAIQGSTAWYGQYTGQGCPVLDPIPYSYTIAAGGTYTLTNSYGDPGFPGCHPTALRISANVSVNGAGTVTTVTATLQFNAACTSGIAISQFSFSPGTVQAGQTSTLSLVLRNCTNQTVQGSSTWYPEFTWAGTGLPPGCPVMDPVSFNYSMAPGGTSTATLGLGDPLASCQATGIQATVTVYVNGVTAAAATATANLVITQPATGGCQVTYTPSTWQGGFTASVTITNNGSSTISGWTLAFTFPGDQKITNAWNAAVTQTGASVTATNLSYNAAIPPGGSQSLGFQGSWATNDASPTSFSVNGMACT